MCTVLVIEDEPDIADNLCDLMEALGYQALQAHDGAMGIEAARSHRPDLILCDMRMPKMTGHDVLRALRSDDDWARDVPVALLTASTEPRLKEKSEALGASAFIRKPFDVDDLIATVNALLGGASS
jgi:CheY-like chemotaxis protein